MTPEQVQDILRTAALTNVSYLKWGDLELRRGLEGDPTSFTITQVKSPDQTSTVSVPTASMSSEVPPLSQEEAQKIEHKIEEMTSVMKVSDQDLIDRLFPLPEDPNGDTL